LSSQPNPFESPSYLSHEKTIEEPSGIKWQLVRFSVLLGWLLVQLYFFLKFFPEILATIDQRNGSLPTHINNVRQMVGRVFDCWWVMILLVVVVVGYCEWSFKGNSKRKARIIIGGVIGGVSSLFTLWVLWACAIAMP